MIIVNFHNVISTPHNEFDLRAAPRINIRQFIATIDWLSERFEIVSYDQLLTGIKSKSCPSHTLCLTFDDGFAGVLHYVYPILQARGITASVMVVTQTLTSNSTLLHFEELELAFRLTTIHRLNADQGRCQLVNTDSDKVDLLLNLKQELKCLPEPERSQKHHQLIQTLGVTREQLEEESDRYTVFKKLDIDQLKFLIDSGWTIGAHTRTHRTLSCLEDDDAVNEIAGARYDLQDRLGLSEIPFAYPYGGPKHIKERDYNLVAESGYTCGMTTTAGSITSETDRYRLPRVNIEDIYLKYPEILSGVNGEKESNLSVKEGCYEQSSIH